MCMLGKTDRFISFHSLFSFDSTTTGADYSPGGRSETGGVLSRPGVCTLRVTRHLSKRPNASPQVSSSIFLSIFLSFFVFRSRRRNGLRDRRNWEVHFKRKKGTYTRALRHPATSMLRLKTSRVKGKDRVRETDRIVIGKYV